jgi:3-hydroxybutyryl-CoA dehydrogenase
MGAAEKSRAAIGGTLAGLAAKGKLDAAGAEASAARITAFMRSAIASSARLVIEAIVEDLGEKRSLFRELENIVPPAAILASNTSSILDHRSCGRTQASGPRRRHALLQSGAADEAGRGRQWMETDPATADRIARNAAAWGKDPVRTNVHAGFIVNRCARPFYGEALRLLAEGATDAADGRCADA